MKDTRPCKTSRILIPALKTMTTDLRKTELGQSLAIYIYIYIHVYIYIYICICIYTFPVIYYVTAHFTHAAKAPPFLNIHRFHCLTYYC